MDNPTTPKDLNNLTLDEIKIELKKLTDVVNATGFLYFLEQYVYVSHPSGIAIRMRDHLFKWQREAAKDFLQHTNIISLKQRQVGFSTIVSSYALWRALFFTGQYITIISLSLRDSTEVLRRTKLTYDYLPAWLKQETSEFARTAMEFKHNGSKIQSLPNTKNPARGLSASVIILDEFAGFERAKDVLAAAIPALSAGTNIPFTNQTIPAQLFVVSTLPQNPVENEYLRLLHQAQERQDSKFHLIEVDTSDISQYQSEAWHKEMLEVLGPRIYQIEILAQEVYDIENSFLNNNILEDLKHINPIRVDFLHPQDVDEEGYMKDMVHMPFLKNEFDADFHYIKGLWIFEDPIDTEEYAVICDVSSGRAEDYSTMQIFKLSNGEQVAEYKGKPDLEQFKHIIWMTTQYYNNAKLSIECNGLGQGVVDYFSETLNYENLYWHQHSKHKIKPGFPMTPSTRSNALAMFASIMGRKELKINSVRTINEVRTFGYTRQGRLEGISGTDDLVMALAQLCYLINSGWACTTKVSQQHLVFGQLIEEVIEDKKNEKPKIPTLKYFEEHFDVEISDEDREFLETARAMGYGVPLDSIIK
jgi:hypothetical protein